MRFRQLAPTAVAVVAALAAPSAAPADAPMHATAKKRCVLKGSTTIKKNRHGRVFERTFRNGDSRLYGCLYRKNRRVLLQESTGDPTFFGEFYDAVKLNGRFVAWRRTVVDDSCRADCGSTTDGETSYLDVSTLDGRREKEYSGDIDTERALVVTNKGAIAWISGGSVFAADSAGERTLYDGEDARPNTLRVRRSTVSWLVGDQQMTEVLR